MTKGWSALRMFVRDEIFETVEVWQGERLFALLLIEGDSLDILNFTVPLSSLPLYMGNCTRDRLSPGTLISCDDPHRFSSFTDLRLSFAKPWWIHSLK